MISRKVRSTGRLMLMMMAALCLKTRVRDVTASLLLKEKSFR
ncbi:unnamed protein product [Linum tenue]|uniref:Uncharacterized protein n=1 Tax=Linum tenue TaxID=586396 RepID=A0AAV0RLA0_9ROSI|nr:unnamed protein product [Linum tenue]